jgi:hypothetical protein
VYLHKTYKIATLLNIFITAPKYVPIFNRKIYDNFVSQFTLLLSYENWEDVLLIEMLTLFSIIFWTLTLEFSIQVFLLKKSKYSHNTKPWLTTGIRTSCANKRKLYLLYRSSNDSNLKKYCKNYCKILSTVIVAAKKQYYNKLLLKSNNKAKATWNIVKTVTNSNNISNNISSMKINDKLSSDSLTIANAFNVYFSSLAENFLNKFTEENTTSHKDPMCYLYKSFRQPFSKIKLRNTTAYEIEKIIQSL